MPVLLDKSARCVMTTAFEIKLQKEKNDVVQAHKTARSSRSRRKNCEVRTGPNQRTNHLSKEAFLTNKIDHSNASFSRTTLFSTKHFSERSSSQKRQKEM